MHSFSKMKVLAIILVSFLWCAQSIQQLEFKEEWPKFQLKYNKSYRSPVEAQKRLAIFKENLDQINAHNALFDKAETTFTKGINKFADWTDDEFMQYVNRGLSKETAANNGKLFEKSENFKAPASVDWRTSGAVSEVKDQGSCGGCWAFSTTGTLEGQLRIVKRNNASLSEQDLIDCSKSNNGCRGGWPYLALDYVKQGGIESENDYPFKGQNGKCSTASSKIVTTISSYEKVKEGDEQALQEAISKKGPVSICLYVSRNFKAYNSGIYVENNCPQNNFNHAVLAVGFGSQNGQDYYIVKNSWASTWGEAGYIRLARNHNNMCGLASRAVVPTL